MQKRSVGAGSEWERILRRIDDLLSDFKTSIRIGVGLAAVGIITFLFLDQQPGVCLPNNPSICSHPWPNPGTIGFLGTLAFMGMAGYVLWHAYEIRPRKEDVHNDEDGEGEGDAKFWNRNI